VVLDPSCAAHRLDIHAERLGELNLAPYSYFCGVFLRCRAPHRATWTTPPRRGPCFLAITDRSIKKLAIGALRSHVVISLSPVL
jgi:hypothetical protein